MSSFFSTFFFFVRGKNHNMHIQILIPMFSVDMQQMINFPKQRKHHEKIYTQKRNFVLQRFFFFKKLITVWLLEIEKKELSTVKHSTISGNKLLLYLYKNLCSWTLLLASLIIIDNWRLSHNQEKLSVILGEMNII